VKGHFNVNTNHTEVFSHHAAESREAILSATRVGQPHNVGANDDEHEKSCHEPCHVAPVLDERPVARADRCRADRRGVCKTEGYFLNKRTNIHSLERLNPYYTSLMFGV